MIHQTNLQITATVRCLKSGSIIAYPTEGVYGLGCDPFNELAVKKLLALKQRLVEKGLILISSDWSQVQHLTQPIAEKQLQAIFTTWPGPVTWVFPASQLAPSWICGKHPTIALRITDHSIAKMLCQQFGKPIVSSSANPEGQPPARTIKEVQQYFAKLREP